MGAKLRVLIVDDSAFFRNRVMAALAPAQDIEVVGTAGNGQEAIALAKNLKPDVITMDVEMPVVDGITAVRRIMTESPTRILMFSALTREGARETLEALDAGAMDFLPKDMGHPSAGNVPAEKQLLERVRDLGKSRLSLSRSGMADYLRTTPRSGAVAPATGASVSSVRADLVAIGASTGGPVALRQVLSALPRNFPLPLVAAVHMPGSFTTAYAERLNASCAISIREAVDRDRLTPGQALLAPGGKQLRVERAAGGYQVRITDPLPGQIYHPSVDLMFESVAESAQARALCVVLTGMGSDGLQGAKQLKRAGASLWSQDEKSCVVYGMPQAVEKAGLSDRVINLDEMGPLMAKLK
ncbi:MAG: chemotaxis response regulator protein-glutamate methylesterase [Candidatus Thiodiazotropha sp.]